MKKTFQLICLAAIMLAACSKQNNLSLDPPVSLAVNVGISMEPATKAIIAGTSFSNGAEVGVQVLKSADDAIYETGASTNVKFTLNDTWGTLSEFYLTNTTGKVHAYYPYVDRTTLGGGETNAELFTTIPASIPASLTTGNETDFMYATTITGAGEVVSNATGRNSASLVMNHAMAQVSFLVYKENYPGAGSFTAFTIEDVDPLTTEHVIVNKAADNDLAMNITNGTITGGEVGVISRTLASARTLEVATADPLYPSTVAATLRTQVASKGTTTLVVPKGPIGVGAVKFGFTVDGKTYYVNNGTEVTWEAGKQYIYKVKLSGTALVISTVTITDWEAIVGENIDIQ
ncbi:MAG: fimbrillin family protein [Bacteroidales bacterium]